MFDEEAEIEQTCSMANRGSSGTPATFNILTEAGEFLHTEASENLIQE